MLIQISIPLQGYAAPLPRERGWGEAFTYNTPGVYSYAFYFVLRFG